MILTMSPTLKLSEIKLEQVCSTINIYDYTNLNSHVTIDNTV